MPLEFKPKTQELDSSFFTIFPGLCKGCGLCIEKCPKKCIVWSNTLGVYGTPSVEADDDCIGCGICQNICPDCAINIEKKVKH
ncbi:MAG: NADH dehydrogenase subunit I [Pelotomaculum sp. PtaU1.Bin035]|nr:MAG: NADH dehydrogenase subunit I [Pelotomaculum sp. PtaU1.Bin035]